MNVPDVNLLLYAHIEAFAEHAKARGWWDALLNGRTEIGVAGPGLFGFVRLVTNRSLFDPPMSVEIALSRVESWLARPNVRFLPPGPRHPEIAFRLLNDVDFGRFPQLRWVNPLR